MPWLPGYESSRPVRIGNAAHDQLQLDMIGEVIDTLHQAGRGGLSHDDTGWALQHELLAHLEKTWAQPDAGIWEIRGPARHFTYSKVMAWVAFDRAIKSAETFGLNGPIEHWQSIRQAIHDEVCQLGVDTERGCFTQAYGSRELDASLLLLPAVGFLPPDDPRVRATIEAIERDLTVDGFVMRYDTRLLDDGLAPGEGAFLACSFWMADALLLVGRKDDAVVLFERLLALRNDVGLLSEEFDVKRGRLVGNFPQAFSCIALVNTAYNIAQAQKTADPDRVVRTAATEL